MTEASASRRSALRELARRAYAATLDAVLHTYAAVAGRSAALDFGAR